MLVRLLLLPQSAVGGEIIDAPNLTVVVAVAGEREDLARWLALACALPSDAELLFCVAGSVPAALHVLPARVRVIVATSGSLVPLLWRDGITAARGDRVALTTDRFSVPPGWLEAARAADLDAWVAVGGTITCDPAPDAIRRAVFFLRYIRFAPPAVRHAVAEVAADNAVYRRADILDHADLLAAGFWEPAFHERFRAAGLRLALDPALEAVYRGHDRPQTFIAHRFAHGREFGRTRGRAASAGRRVLLLLAAPIVPLVILARIAASAAGRPDARLPFVHALGWLIVFCAAWSAGEARGTLDAMTLN